MTTIQDDVGRCKSMQITLLLIYPSPDLGGICPYSSFSPHGYISVCLHTSIQMKLSLKPGKTARGVSLAILQPLHHLLDAIPVPGAESVIGILYDVVEGIDVSIVLSKFWNYRPSSLIVPLQTTSRNSSAFLELGSHIRLLADLLEPLTKMDPNNISSSLQKDVQRLSE
jgi:hypothetical protein